MTPSLAAALRVLGSPPAWFAIAVFLLNDHVLKYQFPSYLTGKLSDFASLYVMPVALIVPMLILTLPLPRIAHGVSIASFIAVGAVFTAIKVDAGLSLSLRTLLVPLTGGGVMAVTDPTDLMALPVLLLSFRAWRSQLRQAPLALLRRMAALPVLALVVFATVATTPGVPPYVQLIADPSRPGTFYALHSNESYYGGSSPTGIYRTSDAGNNWSLIAAGGDRFALDPGDVHGLLVLRGPRIVSIRSDDREPRSTATPQASPYGTRRLFLVTTWSTGDIFMVADSQLVRSRDRGATWVAVHDAAELSDLAATTTVGGLYLVESKRTHRSDDSGATWREVGSFPARSAGLGVDPRDDQRIVAATETGMHLSVDGGQSWRWVWRGKSVAGGRDVRASVVFDPDYPERVYATMGVDVGLLVSGDRGATWRESELAALSVAVGRGPGPRILISADYRGVFRESRPWPDLEPWVKVSRGIPFR
jgi:hypothetical protein